MTTVEKDFQEKQQFIAHDLNVPGHIDPEAQATLWTDLPINDIFNVIKQLDKDGDGRISVDQIVEEFRELSMAKETKKRERMRWRLSGGASNDSCTVNTEECTKKLDDDLRGISCQDEVCKLYQNLCRLHEPELAEQFEKMLLNVINDVRQYQLEHERLARAFRREHEEQERHIRRLEEEIKQQIKCLEERIRLQERERLEQEKEELWNKLNAEIVTLRQTLKQLQQIKIGDGNSNREMQLLTLKKKLEDLRTKNRMVRSELTDTQTNIALTKCETSKLKYQLDEKKYELLANNQVLEEYMNEIYKMRGHLQMLHEAYRSLLYENNNLKQRLESTIGGGLSHRRTSCTDFINSSQSFRSTSHCLTKKSPFISDHLDRQTRDLVQLSTNIQRAKMSDQLEENELDDVFADDLDSGHSSLLESHETNEQIEQDSFGLHHDIRRDSIRGKIQQCAKVSTDLPREPERLFKLALAGDAAVGKTSFVIRLCTGTFSSNLRSTLGVDFQRKLLDVDGHLIALQLWDTAGQERFRSLARTYFRRADGILLLYDVTYERSFLNLRDWVNAIEDGSARRIPIMLIGNKTDARDQTEYLKESHERRAVKYEDGLRLSQEIDALFLETSAKDGTNIFEAVVELTRLLQTNEDVEVNSVGLQLQEIKNKSASSCCRS